MNINNIIQTLQQKHKDYGITLYPAASLGQIEYFEHTYKRKLPDDIKTFYRFCDGFESAEDLFRIVPIDELDSRMEKDFFYIAEYMVYCDMWGLKVNPSDRNDYIIFVGTDQCRELKLTHSFTEFLERFLSGGVFEKGGLYDWHEEIAEKDRDNQPKLLG